MDNNIQDKLQEMIDDEENEIMQPSSNEEEFTKSEPKNGDTVIFLIKKDNIVRVGKVASDFNCIIDQYGTIFYDADIIDSWFVPINKIQETIHYNGTFIKAYEKLASMNSEEAKTKQIEDYINERVVRVKGTLSDDKQFLVELFTRNVRNGKVDFKNYHFMMELLFDNPDNEYNSQIDLRELRTICYNMFSIMNRISQETYDEIYQKLADYTTDGGISLM